MKALNRLRQTIKIAQRSLGWDDALYRQVLNDLTGKSSCKSLSYAQCSTVLDYMKKQGWNPNPNEGQVKKVQYLWLCLRDAKKLTNASHQGLASFCQTYTKKKTWQRASTDELSTMIEVLKAWCQREKVRIKA